MLAVIPRTNEERNKILKIPPRAQVNPRKTVFTFLLTEILVLFYTSVLIHSFIPTALLENPAEGTQWSGNQKRAAFRDLQSNGGKGNKKQVYFTLEEEA